ncbi:MAG TPA: DUF5591 domain-containing protein, partial [Chloroflexota bacterium]|nr:DUF5591 domain-containing protein [Chloroflexota bacterium]
MADGYRPPEGKRVLLIIPCSGGKPYSASRSHRLIAECPWPHGAQSDRPARGASGHCALRCPALLGGLWAARPTCALHGRQCRAHPANALRAGRQLPGLLVPL